MNSSKYRIYVSSWKTYKIRESHLILFWRTQIWKGLTMPRMTKLFLCVPFNTLSIGHYLLHFHFFLRKVFVYIFIFSLFIKAIAKILEQNSRLGSYTSKQRKISNKLMCGNQCFLVPLKKSHSTIPEPYNILLTNDITHLQYVYQI